MTTFPQEDIVQASAAALILIAEEGRIVQANPAAGRLLGCESADLENCRAELLVPPPSRPVFLRHLREVAVASDGMKESVPCDVVHVLTRAKSEISADITLTRVGGQRGACVLATILDTRRHSATEQLLHHRAREVEALNNELSGFANSASHDLKAPLTSMNGLLALCLDELEDGDLNGLRDNLVLARDICRRSARRVESVLAIARAGRDAIPVEDIALDAEITTIWRDMTAGLTTPPVLELDLHHSGRVRTERATLINIVSNLMSNAIRYEDPKKPQHVIRVSSDTGPAGLRMQIKDNGVGIPAADIPRLFRMFERIDRRSGDGLGLCLVRKHITRLGGEITAASVLGEGTEFTLTLPMQQEPVH